jgi:hypothetical protein
MSSTQQQQFQPHQGQNAWERNEAQKPAYAGLNFGIFASEPRTLQQRYLESAAILNYIFGISLVFSASFYAQAVYDTQNN